MTNRLSHADMLGRDFTGWQCVLNGMTALTRAIIEKTIVHGNNGIEFVYEDGSAEAHDWDSKTWSKDPACKGCPVFTLSDFGAIEYSKGHVVFYVENVGEFRLLPKGSRPYYVAVGELHTA